VVVGEQLLHHHHPRLELIQHFYYTIVQHANPAGHVSWGPALGAAGDAGLQNLRRAVPRPQDGVAGHQQARVDAEDAPGVSVLGRRRGGRRDRIHAHSLTSSGKGTRRNGERTGCWTIPSCTCYNLNLKPGNPPGTVPGGSGAGSTPMTIDPQALRPEQFTELRPR